MSRNSLFYSMAKRASVKITSGITKCIFTLEIHTHICHFSLQSTIYSLLTLKLLTFSFKFYRQREEKILNQKNSDNMNIRE